MSNSMSIEQIKSAVKYWWVPLLVGILFIVSGIYTLMTPMETFLVLTVFFSVSFLVSGIFEVFFALSVRDSLEGWGWLLVYGLINLVVGMILINNPEISVATLPIYIGLLVMFRAITAIGSSMDLKRNGVSDWSYLLILGILGIIFSFILIRNPGFVGLSLGVWVAIALITIGIAAAFFSFRLKDLHTTAKKISKG